jgi:hypothetical protein
MHHHHTTIERRAALLAARLTLASLALAVVLCAGCGSEPSSTDGASDLAAVYAQP